MLKVLSVWHPQEIALLRGQAGAQVNVSVDATPSVDLNQVISSIREHYEKMISKNQKELEAWYQRKVSCYSIFHLLWFFFLSSKLTYVNASMASSTDYWYRARSEGKHRDFGNNAHRDQRPEEHISEAADWTPIKFEHGTVYICILKILVKNVTFCDHSIA